MDECLTNNGGCSRSPLVQCLNTMGSFHCGPCPPGMQKNALSSLELRGSSLIGRHLTTSYLILSTGYEGDGKTCTQTNVCATNNGGCYPLATCSSSPGRGPLNIDCFHHLTIATPCAGALPCPAPRGLRTNAPIRII